jgi:hypothetical protein
MLSLFLRSSTNCGSKSGLSLGDMVLCSVELRNCICCVWCEEDREFIERWTTSRRIAWEQVDAGWRGAARADSYVAELCWKGVLTSKEPRRSEFTGCEACCDAATTFFSRQSVSALLGAAWGGPRNRTWIQRRDEYHLQDRMKCSMQCWTNE